MKRNKLFPVLGVVAGIAAIVLAIIVMAGKTASFTEVPEIPSAGSGVSMPDLDTGTRTSYSYYGGDAYTGIQQAGADTARNVKALAEINLKGFDLTTRALNRIPTAIQGAAGAIVQAQQNHTAPDYRFALGAILLVLGLGLIITSLRAMNEISARDSYEAETLSVLRNILAGLSQPDKAEVPARSAEEKEEVPAPAPEENPGNSTPDTKEEKNGSERTEPTPREAIQQIRERYEDPDWEKLEPGFVRCPQCGKRLAVDFLEIRKKCPDCGREYKAAKILKS